MKTVVSITAAVFGIELLAAFAVWSAQPVRAAHQPRRPQRVRIVSGQRPPRVIDGPMAMVREPWKPKDLQWSEYGSVSLDDVNADRERQRRYQQEQMRIFEAMDHAGRGAGDRR